MRIGKLETLHADGGWRTFDFVKVTTGGGLVGWSEYNESFGGPGLTALIHRLAPVRTPHVDSGHLLLPSEPAWGTEVHEAAVRAHPPRAGT